ncbi:MAG: CBS domain-containing protein [Candidatus Bathyarchaeota archaeon]|nr:CBS domain-containing protein [Candidatus Bathyarchaeota archaeon]
MPKSVEEIMVREVQTASSEDTVLRAAEIMNNHEIGSVIVVNDGKPVGIVTERDILKRVVYGRKDPANTKASEVMSKPLVKVKPNVSVTRALRIMLRRRIKKLAVVNSGHLTGILSLTDLVPLVGTQELDELPLNGVPKRVKKVFEIYYDPKRRLRKNCPLTMVGGMAINCLGTKCMWFVNDKCVLLNLVEKLSG